MEFKNKEFDGEYEASEIQIQIENQILRGLLYFPTDKFKKPYPLIIYFHGFPQLFTLIELVKNFQYLLDLGYAFLAFNFRGYRYSEGRISIKSQVTDAIKVIEFAEKMSSNKIFKITDINIIAFDLGAYFALKVSSKTNLINRLTLISPILNLKRHVNSSEFPQVLTYINRFLPGNVNGIENVNEFIELSKREINDDDFKIEIFIKKLLNKKLKIIIGKDDNITPILEVKNIFKNCNLEYELAIIENMNHDCVNEEDLENLNKETIKFYI